MGRKAYIAAVALAWFCGGCAAVCLYGVIAGWLPVALGSIDVLVFTLNMIANIFNAKNVRLGMEMRAIIDRWLPPSPTTVTEGEVR